MWGNVLPILGAVGILVGIASAGALLYFGARTQYGKSTVEQLSADVNNWKNRVDERDARIKNLEDEAERKDAALHRMGEQLQSAQRQIEDLRELVLQKATFNELVDLTKMHEANAQRRAEERSKEHAAMMATMNANQNIGHEILNAIKTLRSFISTAFNELRALVKGTP